MENKKATVPNYKYKLYYWQAPFRGNFVQLLLEELGLKYQRLNAEKLYPNKSIKLQYPGMAPPYLYDVSTKKYYSQMPAILFYLSKKHGFWPKNPEKEALALKVIADCHDILLEITNCYGQKMWTKKEWEKFRKERFVKWLKIFAQTGKAHGLKKDKGGKKSSKKGKKKSSKKKSTKKSSSSGRKKKSSKKKSTKKSSKRSRKKK